MPSVVWWNVGRFFSTKGSPVARALGATRREGWDAAAYQAKLRAVSAVLRDACRDGPPALLGLCEVEDASVLADIVEACGWDLAEVPARGDALDGYDVALAYDAAWLTPVGEAESHTVHNRFATRDVLVARFKTLAGGPFTVMAAHWPSRTVSDSDALRLALGDYTKRLINREVMFDPQDLVAPDGTPRPPTANAARDRWQTPVLVLGDFNDEPFDRSMRHMMDAWREPSDVPQAPRLSRSRGLAAVATYLRNRPRLYNPTWRLLGQPPGGTLHWNGRWWMLDQILASAGLLHGGPPRLDPGSVRIHAPRTVADGDGTVAVTTASGRPRAFDAKTHAGVSDHLPLVCSLELPTA